MKGIDSPFPKILAVGISVLLCFLAMRSASADMATGASINESRATYILYVNNQHASASDSNPGTNPNLPLKTIYKAAQTAGQNVMKSISTKIIIYPGTYRENSIVFGFNGNQPDAPTIFEALNPGTVIISGSDIWAGWTPAGNDVYTHDWPYDWGFLANPWPGSATIQPLGLRKEMIFVNASLLAQVLSKEEMQSQVNSFYINESDNLSYIHLSPGSNINNVAVEVTTRQLLFRGIQVKNLVLRGLIFQHSTNSEFGGGGNTVQISVNDSLLVENVKSFWNNGNGFTFYGSNITVRNCEANYNGVHGLHTYGADNLLVEDTEMSFNNWRGAMGELYDWDPGNKQALARKHLWRRVNASNNKAAGIWFDWDNADVRIEDSVFCNNYIRSVFLEASQGPFYLKNNTICNTKTFGKFQGGLYITESRNITLDGNILYGNGLTQIGVDYGEGRVVTNHETGEQMIMRAENVALMSNIVMGKNSSQSQIEITNRDYFLSSFSSNNNLWFNPSNNTNFSIKKSWSSLEAIYNLSGWQARTGQDLDSCFKDPLFADPENCNFSRSQLHRADTNVNGRIDMAELTTFIDLWKLSNVDVTIRELIEAITLWKAGCP